MPVKTRLLIMSDTHSNTFEVKAAHKADVVIHCGDLSQYSEMEHYHKTIDMLCRLDAPLKLVISGNHDQGIQDDKYDELLASKIAWWSTAGRTAEQVTRLFGPPGEPRRLLESPRAKAAGIVFLDEGNYSFRLGNGAILNVYASPWTPDMFGGRAYQYPPDEGHDFAIANNTHIAITHGPPRGVLDWTRSGQRAGCPQLFAAIATAKPLLHCFGHIHGAWGGKLVAWRNDGSGSSSSRNRQNHRRRSPRNINVSTEVDLDNSVPLENLPKLIRNQKDPAAVAQSKAARKAQYDRQGLCHASHLSGDANPLVPGQNTLFVNASWEFSPPGQDAGMMNHWPWLVDIELPSREEAARKNINPWA
ncbi:hypothetical protein PG991_013999 [Apiospora marii]|uniref:Calcineurin-like phosphoesterase domain-containing protein n=1 Tax=Apiospora marii TaxID=335849 RepID=A0ABR1R7R9_9PEZI